MYRRVQVELPHPDERDATWEVHLPDGQVHEEKWKPSWQRTAAVTAVGIERPFVALNVTLQGHASILGSWSFGGLRDSRPALFFDGRSGRALGSSEYLSGNSWFLIMPKGGILHADGNRITPTEALGEPFGNWPGLVAERYEASAATELRLDLDGQGYRYRLVAEAPGAMLEAPPMPAFLAPLEDAVLAFESELPVVRLPAAPDGADGPAYLQRWSIELATRDGATVEQRSADTLRPEQQLDGSYRVRLEELVPGPDVGDWDLEVAGPLGRGLSRGLSLLPDMRFEVEDRPGIAGPELRASRVFAQTRDGVRVLEEGDVAAPALGGWFLRDQNRNGRIPFTVEDSRTGREATAMIRLSTIQWQWTSPGVPASPQNVPQRFAIDDLQPDTAPRLLASNGGIAATPPTGRFVGTGITGRVPTTA